VRVEVEFHDGTVTITQEDLDIVSMTSASVSNRAGGAVLCLGRAVGQVIATLGAGSDIAIDALIEEFHGTMVRSVLPASRAVPPGVHG
jgi:hypothetical protein